MSVGYNLILTRLKLSNLFCKHPAIVFNNVKLFTANQTDELLSKHLTFQHFMTRQYKTLNHTEKSK